jgi:acyl-CoA synthetase (NDP forming)
VATSLSAKAPSSGLRLGLLTPSGGIGVLLADAFSKAGFELPEMPPEIQRGWRARIPFASTRNPVDVTAQLVNEPALYDRFVQDMLGSGSLDHLVVFLPHASREDGLTSAVVRAADSRQRAVSLSVVGSVDSAHEAWLREHGINVFATPRQAADVLRRLNDRARQPGMEQVARPRSIGPVPERPSTGPIVDEIESKRIVAAWDIPVVSEALVSSPDEAADCALRYGYPVVLKRIEPNVTHKAVRGGVVVGLTDGDAVRAAAEQLMLDAGVGTRFVIQPHVLGDEILLSVTNDPEWGPLALLGVGGTGVEEHGDVHFRTAPPTTATVQSMISESPALSAILQLGRRTGSVETLTRMLGALTSLIEDTDIRAVELNPVIVRPDGECVAVDALIEWKDRTGAQDERSHLHG